MRLGWHVPRPILAHMIGIGARIAHPKYGEGAIFGESGAAWRIFFQEHGEKELAKTYESYEVVEPAPESAGGGIELEDVIAAVENVFDQYLESPDPIDLGDNGEGARWNCAQGGKSEVQGNTHRDVLPQDCDAP